MCTSLLQRNTSLGMRGVPTPPFSSTVPSLYYSRSVGTSRLPRVRASLPHCSEYHRVRAMHTTDQHVLAKHIKARHTSVFVVIKTIKKGFCFESVHEVFQGCSKWRSALLTQVTPSPLLCLPNHVRRSLLQCRHHERRLKTSCRAQ